MAEEGTADWDQYDSRWLRATVAVLVLTLVMDVWARLWWYAFCSALFLVVHLWSTRPNRKKRWDRSAFQFFLSVAILVPPPLYELAPGRSFSRPIFYFSLTALVAGVVALIFDTRHADLRAGR